MSITIDQAIEQLTALKSQSKLGGDTCLVISLPETEWFEVEALKIENDDDGALALVCGTPHEFGPDPGEVMSLVSYSTELGLYDADVCDILGFDAVNFDGRTDVIEYALNSGLSAENIEARIKRWHEANYGAA